MFLIPALNLCYGTNILAANNMDHNNADRTTFRIFSVNHICFKGNCITLVELEQKKPEEFDEAAVPSTIKSFGVLGT